MATISGSYNPATNKVTLTITGAPAGDLIVYKQDQGTIDNDSPRAVIVDQRTYNGSSATVVDHMPAAKTITYYAFVDGVRQDTATIDVAAQFTGVWLMSLSDPDAGRRINVVRDDRNTWRHRERRGWTGDVVGTTRTVGVSDVAMSGRTGYMEIFCTSDSELAAVDQIIRQGIVCVRACTPVSYPAGYLLIDRYQERLRPQGGGRLEVDWVHTWPAGFRDKLPDE